MLKIEYGDCLNAVVKSTDKVVLVHGCNMQGVMGAGFASHVKRLFPYAYKAYKDVHKHGFYHLGQVILAEDENSNVIVANAITQQFYGRCENVRYVDYDAVACSALAVATWAGLSEYAIHMPLIGGGLGNGDEKRLTAILQAAYNDVDATLWLME